MQTIKLNAHVGMDGILKLEVPVTSLIDTDLEVVLIMQAIPTGSPNAISNSPGSVSPAPDQEEPISNELGIENGWPVGFFRRTYGSLRNNPLQL